MPAPIAAAVTIGVLRRIGPQILAVILPIVLTGALAGTYLLFAMAAQDSPTPPKPPIAPECPIPIPPGGGAPGGNWPDDPTVGVPDQQQLANMAAVIKAGEDKNVPEYGQIVAIAVAAQESGWRVVDHGDAAGPDSRGLFQQRDSWGPESVRMDPYGSAGLFFDALLKVPNWKDLSIGKAGQAVQGSADASGDWYQQHEPIARQAFAVITGNTTEIDCGDNGNAMSCPASSWPSVENGLTPDALRVLRCGGQNFPDIESVGGIGDRPANVDDDHQTGRAIDFMIPDWKSDTGKKLGDELAEFMQQHHAELGVKYIIWRTSIWSVERSDEGWRTCGGPSASCYSGSDPTTAHLDHVHVSVFGNSAGTGDTGGGDWVNPLHGSNYTMTVAYGTPGDWAAGYHQAVDLATDVGTQIVAGCTGKVLSTGMGGAYGNLTKIDCGGGIQTWYAHQDAITVAAGADVIAGQTIGQVGYTGRVKPPGPAGAHLHLEVRENDRDIDPQKFYAERGVTI